jgi:hypothetical protein
MIFADIATQYLTDPSLELLTQLRIQIQQSGNYGPGTNPEANALPLLNSGNAEAAIAELEALMPGAFLNPGIHLLLAEGHHQLGHSDDANREAAWYQASLSGILSTGDGTTEHPWAVLMISDEYDVLRALKKTSTQQELVQLSGKTMDHHQCADGSEYSFELTWTL